MIAAMEEAFRWEHRPHHDCHINRRVSGILAHFCEALVSTAPRSWSERDWCRSQHCPRSPFGLSSLQALYYVRFPFYGFWGFLTILPSPPPNPSFRPVLFSANSHMRDASCAGVSPDRGWPVNRLPLIHGMQTRGRVGCWLRVKTAHWQLAPGPPSKFSSAWSLRVRRDWFLLPLPCRCLRSTRPYWSLWLVWAPGGGLAYAMALGARGGVGGYLRSSHVGSLSICVVTCMVTIVTKYSAPYCVVSNVTKNTLWTSLYGSVKCCGKTG